MYLHMVRSAVTDTPSLADCLFRPAREHLLHMLGYRRRSFATFAALGATPEFLLHQAGATARQIRADLRNATDLAGLEAAVNALAAHVASTDFPAPVKASGLKRARQQ